MKKLLVVMMLLFLVACEEETEEYLYGNLAENHVDSYLEGETMDGKYILYYYSKTCPGCNSVKQEVIPFLMEFTLLDVYLLNTAEMYDVSIFTEFVGTPSLFIVDGSKTLYETYIGVDRVREFMDAYKESNINITTFEEQHFASISELESSEGRYTILYSEQEKPNQELLLQLFRLSSNEVMFINVDQANEDLLLLFPYEQLPMLFIEGSEVTVVGNEHMNAYFKED